MPWAVAVLRGKGDPEQSGLCPTRFLLLWGASWKDVCKSLTSLNLESMFWLLYWAESMQTAQLQSWWFPAGPCDPVHDDSNPLSLQSPASLLHWGLRCPSCPGQLLF